MNYNPSEKVDGGGKAKPGEYSFYVGAAEEKTFRSGNEGAEITLQVAAFPDRDVKVFDRMTYVPTALWKVEQFLTALGFDFNHPPAVHALCGLAGKARFKTNDKGYLEVDEYLPASANNGPDGKLGEAPF